MTKTKDSTFFENKLLDFIAEPDPLFFHDAMDNRTAHGNRSFKKGKRPKGCS